MPATALAMAPRHRYRFAGGDKSHRAAEAPTVGFLLIMLSLPYGCQAAASIFCPCQTRAIAITAA